MNIQTTRFGEIEFPEDVMMTFPDGIFGFPEDTRYVLLEHNIEGSPFKWLQSLDSPSLAFIVLDPVTIEPRYRLTIDVDTAQAIGTTDIDDCALMSIVNIPHDQPARMTANLKAPLVVNANTRLGRQMILGSQVFALSTPIFPHLQEVDHDAEVGEGDYCHRVAL